MDNYHFIQKIKGLKQIQPSDNWQADLRQKLLIEKRTQDLLCQDFDLRTSATWGLFSFLKGFSQPRMLLRPVFAFLIILGLFGFSLAGLAIASQKSLPGDWLYVMKTASEQTRLVLTKDIGNKAKIQAEFTEKRIEELNQVINQSVDSEKSVDLEKKEEKTELAVNRLHQQLISLKDQLPKIEKKIEPNKALAIAETVIEKSNKAEQILNEAKEKGEKEGLLEESEMSQKLVDVSETAKEVLSDAQKTVEILALILESEEETQEIGPDIEAEKDPVGLFNSQTSTIDIQIPQEESTQESTPPEEILEIQFLQLK